MLAVLLIWVRVHLLTLILWLIFHLFIFYSLYYKSLIQYFISLDGEVALAYCSVSETESDFHLLRFLKGTFVKKIELMCSYICIEWILTKYLLPMFFLIKWNWFSFKLFTREKNISIFHVITFDSHIFSKFACIFYEYVLIMFSFHYQLSKQLDLRMSNHNDKNKEDLTVHHIIPKNYGAWQKITCWRWRD